VSLKSKRGRQLAARDVLACLIRDYFLLPHCFTVLAQGQFIRNGHGGIHTEKVQTSLHFEALFRFAASAGSDTNTADSKRALAAMIDRMRMNPPMGS
jgi:hypothetical protein